MNEKLRIAERAVLKAKMLSNDHVCGVLKDPEGFAEALCDRRCPNGGKCTGMGAPPEEDPALNEPLQCWENARCWRAYDNAVGNPRHC